MRRTITDDLSVLRENMMFISENLRLHKKNIVDFIQSDYLPANLIGRTSTIQIARIKEMKKVSRATLGETLTGLIYQVLNFQSSPRIIYTGFAPGAINIFRQLIGLGEVKWRDEMITTLNR